MNRQHRVDKRVDKMEYTPDEAAVILHVSKSTLQRMRREGTGPAFIRYGTRTIRYSSADLIRWMNRGRHAA